MHVRLRESLKSPRRHREDRNAPQRGEEKLDLKKPVFKGTVSKSAAIQSTDLKPAHYEVAPLLKSCGGLPCVDIIKSAHCLQAPGLSPANLAPQIKTHLAPFLGQERLFISARFVFVFQPDGDPQAAALSTFTSRTDSIVCLSPLPGDRDLVSLSLLTTQEPILLPCYSGLRWLNLG